MEAITCKLSVSLKPMVRPPRLISELPRGKPCSHLGQCRWVGVIWLPALFKLMFSGSHLSLNPAGSGEAEACLPPRKRGLVLMRSAETERAPTHAG